MHRRNARLRAVRITFCESSELFDRSASGGRLEQLPWSKAERPMPPVRPILENSTACTMSNAKNLVRQPRLSRARRKRFLWKTFKQQSKSVMICSVSFKLAPRPPIPVAWCTRCADPVPELVEGLVVQSNIYGEFDPGSGRTLAACLTHASRTMKESLLSRLVANG